MDENIHEIIELKIANRNRVQKNMDAIEFLIKTCPAQYVSVLTDTIGILKAIKNAKSKTLGRNQIVRW